HEVMGVTPLTMAAMNGRTEVVTYLLDRGANIEARSVGEGYTALHFAANRLQFEVGRLLVHRGADVRARDDAGYTVLHMLEPRYEGSLEFAQFLVDDGADPAAKDNWGKGIARKLFQLLQKYQEESSG